jgi:hypothetical protein
MELGTKEGEREQVRGRTRWWRFFSLSHLSRIIWGCYIIASGFHAFTNVMLPACTQRLSTKGKTEDFEYMTKAYMNLPCITPVAHWIGIDSGHREAGEITKRKTPTPYMSSLPNELGLHLPLTLTCATFLGWHNWSLIIVVIRLWYYGVHDTPFMVSSLLINSLPQRQPPPLSIFTLSRDSPWEFPDAIIQFDVYRRRGLSSINKSLRIQSLSNFKAPEAEVLFIYLFGGEEERKSLFS